MHNVHCSRYTSATESWASSWRPHRTGAPEKNDDNQLAGCNAEMETMRRWLVGLSVALAASAVYLYAFPTATLIYESVVVLHIFAGCMFVVFVIPGMGKLLQGKS